MTSTDSTRRFGSRSWRLVAAGAAVALTSSAIVAAGGGTAGAQSAPQAQSVGRFLDGAAGGMPIQAIVDVKDARAIAPGSTSEQNPFDLKLFNQADINQLDGAINLPTAPAVDAGLVNQVARANFDGASTGAAGAVENDGGVNAGDKNNGDPRLASIALTPDAVPTKIPGLPSSIPGLPSGLPGTQSLASLGGVQASLGAVTAIAKTQRGGDAETPHSSLAGMQLRLGSPALGALLTQLKGLLSGSAINGTPITLPSLPSSPFELPKDCTLTAPKVDDISLEGGGVVISPDDAAVTIDVATLVKQVLGKDITDLDTSNFDLTSFLVKNLPTILSKGLTKIVTGLVGADQNSGLQGQFTKCSAALSKVPGLGDALTMVTTALSKGEQQLLDAINDLSDQFSTAFSGPLGQLASGLENAVDIGLNVQSGPGIQQHDKKYPFESNLEATPDQATDVVKGQTLVRAIEIQVGNGASGGLPKGFPSLPGLPSSFTGTNNFTNDAHATKLTAGGAAQAAPLAAAPGDGGLNLALGNAAAGPSNNSAAAAEPGTSSTPANNGVPSTAVPVGVPAGAAADHGGSPVLPIVALLLLAGVAGGGFLTWRLRGRLH